MGLSKSNRHKRTKTGAKKATYCKKRKFNMARQPSNTRIGEEKLQKLRGRGGNIKTRALRINSGNFTIKSHQFTAMGQIQQVMYHPSSNELMRTNTLTKGAVIRLESPRIKQFCEEKIEKLSEVDPKLHENMSKGRLYGIINSRPGQCGRADGYILQGEELSFYMDKFKKRSK